MKNCIVTLIIAAVIGVPVTLLVMASSFWLSHGAGSIGFIVMIIAVPGILTESSWGIAGVVIVQTVYYIFIAVGLKALFRYYFSTEQKIAADMVVKFVLLTKRRQPGFVESVE